MLRHPRVLTAMVAASALLFGIATSGHAAGVDAQTRAGLRADVDRVTTTIANSVETGRAVVASHLAAAVCVADASGRLAPVAAGDARFTSASFDQATMIVHGAADVTPVPAYDPAPPSSPSTDANVDELDAALAVLRRAQADVEAEVAALASKARATEQQCESALRAMAALVDEIVRRTDELIAANPKAASDAASSLSVARDAVVAAEDGGIEQWLAAAAGVESSHTAAVRAEAEAAEAARQAALEADEADGGAEEEFRGPGEVPRSWFCEWSGGQPSVDPITYEVVFYC